MESQFSKLFLLCCVGLLLFCLVKAEENRKEKQVGTGITFAIPGLNFLNGGNNGGNIFGPQTFTRTLVSTVSTVTTASFRTCTAVMAAITPCAGRRKREVQGEEDNEVEKEVDATPVMKLIIGTTTISNPVDVTEYLEAHKLSTNSIIYPNEVIPSDLIHSSPESVQEGTTQLYPSHDNVEEQFDSISHDDVDLTTEAAVVLDDTLDDNDNTTPNPIILDVLDKARLGLTTTVTTIIRVTSVATTIASGAMNTLTVSYLGCAPPSYPVSGIPCV